MIKMGIPLMNPARLRDGYKTVKDGEVLNIDGIKIEVVEVMGHTVGHVCYIIDDKILFSGDCLVVNENGGYSLFEFFDMSKLFAHIDESAVSKRGKPFDPTAPKSIRK